jgi:iron complex outermembrane receptor protein
MDHPSAILRLQQEQLSCLALIGNREYTSTLKGIAPLLKPLRENPDFFKDAIVIDRVIGKSAAFLLIKGQIRSIHALIISQHALTLLNQHPIEVTYDKLVPYIINNTNTGMCPMEASVLEIEDPELAFHTLIAKVQEMSQQRQ